MKYVLLFAETEQFANDMAAMGPSERERAYDRVNEWFAKHADKPRGGSKLTAPETATTVRLDRGEPVIIDGPFVEGKGVVSGYVEIEVADLDEAMRGASAWSIGDRELMAAFVSQVNESPFCVAAHTATSGLWYRNDAKVAAALADLDTAPMEEPLRATLRLLGKLTRDHSVEADDVRAVLYAGVSPEQIEDALAVCLAFNITDRLANAFDFTVAEPAAMTAGAKHLLQRGYR